MEGSRMLTTSGILRPTLEEWQTLRQLTHEDRRQLRPGWPTRRFVNTVLGTSVATRDADVYSAVPGWIETTRRSTP
jgi:hypothetical protein